MSLQIVQARNDLLSKLGIETAAEASALTLQDVVVALNGASAVVEPITESGRREVWATRAHRWFEASELLAAMSEEPAHDTRSLNPQQMLTPGD